VGLADLVHAAGGAMTAAAASAVHRHARAGGHPVFHAPLLHFLTFGAVLFALSQWATPPDVIRVHETDLQQLRDDWLKSAGRRPTRVELQASVQQFAGDEALVREALRLGLDAADPVVNQRLARNLRFAFPQRAGDDATLAAEARALGMVDQDLVIRRRLVDLMEKRMVENARFTEGELRAYVAAHPGRYAAPARYRFTQVFVRREQGAARAAALLAQLRVGAADPAASGDPFPLAREREADSARDIERLLGAEVAAAVASAPVGEWMGPAPSAFGWHLVRVSAVSEGAPRPFEDVRGPAALALQADRREEAVRQGRAQIAARYRIELPSEYPEASP